jgi:hypothetical protein
MLADSGPIMDLWVSGGPFVGTNRANGYVTVEPGWSLHETADIDPLSPYGVVRSWFGTPTTIYEVPNVKTIQIERSLDADASSCTFTIVNQKMDANNSYDPFKIAGFQFSIGNPGYYSPTRGDTSLAASRWGQLPNDWNGILAPNALVRTYEGYGGYSENVPVSLTTALAAGNVVQTGTWLIDTVTMDSTGIISVACRDMGKLLIDQFAYPPLVPEGRMPLTFNRFRLPVGREYPATNYYSISHPVSNSPAGVPKHVVAASAPLDGAGYVIFGNDGGAFAYGSMTFQGSEGGATLASPMIGGAVRPQGDGYWMCSEDGGVFAFGAATFYGNMVAHDPPLAAPISGMAAAPGGDGYWLCSRDGGVYAFGPGAGFFGSAVAPPLGTNVIVGISPTETGLGYWLVSIFGSVYAYGDAQYAGNPTIPTNVTVKGIAGYGNDGYFVVYDGPTHGVVGMGPAGIVPVEPTAYNNWKAATLADPIVGIFRSPGQEGFWVVGGDGGIYSFGVNQFYGSLPGPFTVNVTEDANIRDYTDIVRQLCRWAGFADDSAAPGGTFSPGVLGLLESTGAYNPDQMPPDMWDKKSISDCIGIVRDIVGYVFWVGEDGGVNFRHPNWGTTGNILPNGARTNFVPEVDDRWNLLSYSVVLSDEAVRSQILISSNEIPEYPRDANSFEGITTTTLNVTNPWLHGMIRPAMWINEYFNNNVEQAALANSIEAHIVAATRRGSITCIANPLIQVDDQVFVSESVSSDAYVHYVRSISSSLDLDSGSYTMSMNTNWLGDIPQGTGSTPGAAVSFRVEAPATVTPGVPFAVTVTALDALGVVVTTGPSSTLSVTLSMFGGSPTLAGTLTFNLIAGVATVSDLTLTGGSGTIVATSGTVTGSDVIGSWGAATQMNPLNLSSSYPLVGEANTATFGVYDADFNLVGDYSGPVTIVPISGPGTISGSLTQNAVNGVATFVITGTVAGALSANLTSPGLPDFIAWNYAILSVVDQVMILGQYGGTTTSDPILIFGWVGDGIYQWGGFRGRAQISVDSGPGSLVGSGATIVYASDGSISVAGSFTFSDLYLDTPGSYDLLISTPDDAYTSAIVSYTVA